MSNKIDNTYRKVRFVCIVIVAICALTSLSVDVINQLIPHETKVTKDKEQSYDN